MEKKSCFSTIIILALILSSFTTPQTASAAAGDIGDSVLDTLDFETTQAEEPDIINVSGNIFAIAYEGPDDDGFVKTVDISSDGTTISDAVLASLEFDTDRARFVDIIHVSGDIFAIAYQGPDSDGFVKTVDISSDGTTISTAGLATLEFDTSQGSNPDIIHVSGDIFAIAYQGPGSDGFVKTVDISTDGTAISTAGLASLEFDTDQGLDPAIVHVSGDIFAITYGGTGNDGFVKTVDISTDGTAISTAGLASLEFETTDVDETSIINVSGNIFAIAYEGPDDDGFVKTVNISSDGTAISTAGLDTLEFDTDTGLDPKITNVFADSFAIVYRGPDSDGFVKTVTIDDAGDIGNTVIDTFEYDTSGGTTPDVINVSGSIFAIVYRDSDQDGTVVSISVEQPTTGNLGITDSINAFKSKIKLPAENLGMTDTQSAAGSTGTVTMSITLPDGVSGTISSEIVTVTNPTTSGNSISFLGTTYDASFSSTTLCDNGCTIQFTFTQADLDAAGLSLSEVTIFEDPEEDGTFVPLTTTVTDDAPSPFTVQATTTSSGTTFGAGASSSSSSSTGSSGGGYTDGTPPSFSKAFAENEYPITINDNSFTYSQLKNPVPTTLIETGKLAKIKVLLYENRGPERVDYFALYTNLDNNIMRGDSSDTAIMWEKGEKLQVNDPDNIFSSVSVSSTTEGNKFAIIFDIIFEEPIGESDIKLRTWDVKRNGITLDIVDAWNIIEGKPVMDPEPIFSVEQEPIMDPEPGISSTIQKWGGYSSETATDSELLYMVGLHGDYIPSWVKEMVRWINHNLISEQEFLDIIYYLYENDIVH